MPRIVINVCYGGFGLSEKAEALYLQYTRKKDVSDVYSTFRSRADPDLVRVVEELGDAASETYANLKCIDVPDDVDWVIMDYDGQEWVAERHRVWRYTTNE